MALNKDRQIEFLLGGSEALSRGWGWDSDPRDRNAWQGELELPGQGGTGVSAPKTAQAQQLCSGH